MGVVERVRLGDGTMGVATRHLGWRLVEVTGALKHVAVQGSGRFWRRAEEGAELETFTGRPKVKCQ